MSPQILQAATGRPDARKEQRALAFQRISVIRLPEHPLASGEPVSDWHIAISLSPSGLCFHSPYAIREQSFLRIDFVTRDPSDKITVRGIVKWVHEHPAQGRFAIGVELLPLDGEEQEAWMRFLSPRLHRDDATT